MTLSTEHYLAGFDPATTMLKTAAGFLHGADSAPFLSRPLAGLGRTANRLPPAARQALYTAAGWTDTIQPAELDELRSAELAGWAAGLYPNRPVPAVALGAPNGAAIFLLALLGVPWLPQTFSLPVGRPVDRGRTDPDNPQEAVEWSKGPADRLLEANPEIELHHLLDPVRSRLQGRVSTGFRIKLLRLEEPYRSYIHAHLTPGGTLLLIDCRLKWPTTEVAARHIFQFGASGGASRQDYFEGSEQAREFLRRQGSARAGWNPPRPDADRTEAEWGYAPAWDEEIVDLARESGYRVVRLAFDHPEDLSPLVADLYMWAYRRRNIASHRLLASTFGLVEPYWTLRTGSTPFWLLFPSDASLGNLAGYLDEREFEEIGLTFFSPGLESIGLASPEQTRDILSRATRSGRFIGMSEEAWPADLSVHFGYSTGIREAFPARYPLPGPLGLELLDEFLESRSGRYAVEWNGT